MIGILATRSIDFLCFQLWILLPWELISCRRAWRRRRRQMDSGREQRTRWSRAVTSAEPATWCSGGDVAKPSAGCRHYGAGALRLQHRGSPILSFPLFFAPLLLSSPATRYGPLASRDGRGQTNYQSRRKKTEGLLVFHAAKKEPSDPDRTIYIVHGLFSGEPHWRPFAGPLPPLSANCNKPRGRPPPPPNPPCTIFTWFRPGQVGLRPKPISVARISREGQLSIATEAVFPPRRPSSSCHLWATVRRHCPPASHRRRHRRLPPSPTSSPPSSANVHRRRCRICPSRSSPVRLTG